MAATLFVFTSFITLVWLASWVFSVLRSIHALPDDIYQVLEALEVLFIYLDAALCVVVVMRGLWQYILSVIRGES